MFAKLCLTFISYVKLWFILRFWYITVGYISKQNRIKIRLLNLYTQKRFL